MLLSSYSFQSLKFRGVALWLSRASSSSSFKEAETGLKLFEDTLIQIEDDDSVTRIGMEDHASAEVGILHNAANQALGKNHLHESVRSAELFVAAVFGEEEKTLAVSCPSWIECGVVDESGKRWSMPKQEWEPFTWQIFRAEDIPVEKIVRFQMAPFSQEGWEDSMATATPRTLSHKRVSDIILGSQFPVYSHIL